MDVGMKGCLTCRAALLAQQAKCTAMMTRRKYDELKSTKKPRMGT